MGLSNGEVPVSPGRDPQSRNPARTQIPIPTFRKRSPSPSLSSGDDNKWKLQYEESEKRRKELLSQLHQGDRDRKELIKKNGKLLQQREKLEKELEVKDMETLKLRSLSEAVCREYDQLRNKYELDTGTMNEAMNRATQWYRQNRQLKRRSTILVRKMLQLSPESVQDIEDEPDSGEADEMENLRKTIFNLNSEIAKLQSELNAAKLQEFEAQEQLVEFQSLLEKERVARARLENELEELRAGKENLLHVNRLVAQEVNNLRELYQHEKMKGDKLVNDVESAKNERDILSRQSQILMSDATISDKLMDALLEIETLKNSILEERQTFTAEIQKLQEKLEETEVSHDVEILEEKVKILETELNSSVERAERAEACSDELQGKIKSLELELLSKTAGAELRASLSQPTPISSPPPPPPPPPPILPPPPPPPPPPLKMSTNIIIKKEANKNPTADLETLEGSDQNSPKPTVQPAAIDELINEIKGGRFTLKRAKVKKEKSKDEKPAAVQEIMNVLGALRRRPGGRTPSFKMKKTDLSAVDGSTVKI